MLLFRYRRVGKESSRMAVLERVVRGASRALGIDPPDDDELSYRDDDADVASVHHGPIAADPETESSPPSA